MAKSILESVRQWAWPAIAGIALGMAYIGFSAQPANNVVNHPRSYASAVAVAAPSVVSIYTQRVTPESEELLNDPTYRLYRNLGAIRADSQQSTVLGSGIIISSDGFIVTNRHVIVGATNILVVLADGRETRASVYAADELSDLALLKINEPNLTAFNLGNLTTPYVGDIVLAIGNPLGVGITVTQGIISATDRVGGDGGNGLYLQLDAAINPGNSGGAIVNTKGELVGISTSVLGSQTEGISFAIPMPMVKFVVENLIENGRVIRGWLGVSGGSVNRALASQLGLPTDHALAVLGVAPNGPAERAGIMRGDIIVAWNGEPMTSAAAVVRNVTTARPGDVLNLTVWRNNQQLDVALEVEEQPAFNPPSN